MNGTHDDVDLDRSQSREAFWLCRADRGLPPRGYQLAPGSGACGSL